MSRFWRRSGPLERHALATGVKLDRGDIIRIVTGDGAGYGDPKRRERAATEADLKDGYLTPERAREIYGFG